jgi:hypothetical protein
MKSKAVKQLRKIIVRLIIKKGCTARYNLHQKEIYNIKTIVNILFIISILLQLGFQYCRWVLEF